MSTGPLKSVSPGAGPLDHGALAAVVRSGVPTLGTFIGAASPVAAEVCAAAGSTGGCSISGTGPGGRPGPHLTPSRSD